MIPKPQTLNPWGGRDRHTEFTSADTRVWGGNGLLNLWWVFSWGFGFEWWLQKVCESLVYRGQLPLPEIARYTGMNITQLRNCLLVLIQHNCAQAFKVEHEGTLLFSMCAPPVFYAVQIVIDCWDYHGGFFGKIVRGKYSFVGSSSTSSSSSTFILSNLWWQELLVPGVGSAPQRVSTSYIALTDNILHRLRFPKFLVLVKEDVGDQVFS